jgi:hypothetical protein
MVQNVHVRTSHEQKKIPIQPKPNLTEVLLSQRLQNLAFILFMVLKRLHPINIDYR